jgi:gamma-glutamylcyclotransferase
LSLYFAYGSNMAGSEMERTEARHRFLGPARLEGFRLELRRRSIRWGGGAADIVPARGECVWGALYELADDALAGLDAKEGAGYAYRRVQVDVALGDEPRPAVAYEVARKEPAEVPPTPEYVRLLIAGARERGLPAAYIRWLEARLDRLAR